MSDTSQHLEAAIEKEKQKNRVMPRHPESRLDPDWLFLYEKLPASEWYSSDYAYKTSGWLNVHTNIRKRQRILRQLSEEYLMGALNWENYRSQILERIGIHVLKLHQHHSVEDRGFFPDFVSSYPQLKRGFEILEKDHVKLDALLDDLLLLNDELAKADIEDKALAERLYQNLVTGTDFLSQHLTDEEDLVVPILGLRDG
ncbi:hemerythrin domain-containing protein [Psychrobacter sp. FDAARGOS_221]|uniref:hemerythrin domain-containing protein n=1 Tax=Psychrobacter sp. FDAARGOS_221 TaxID=1975705 RepID=UPI000BB58F4D|nr:hemerythrin domain-containing protein [Psychrobacter sp. FDAARGOS_221]PNK60945.1 hemerythrin domain-containing protein [Psychrobacter sp. FDAARGOS_221]